MTIKEQELKVVGRLKCAREKALLSQLDLSMMSGVPQNMITYIETGKRVPTLTTMLKLCKALNISPAVVFSDSDDEVIENKKLVISLIERYMN